MVALRGEVTIKKNPQISLKIRVWGFLGARSSNPGCVFQNFHQKVVKSDNGNFPDFPGFRAIFRISGEQFKNRLRIRIPGPKLPIWVYFHGHWAICKKCQFPGFSRISEIPKNLSSFTVFKLER